MQALFPRLSLARSTDVTKIANELVSNVTQLKLWFNLQAIKTARWDY